MTWLLIVIAAALITGAYAVSLRLHPWRPCRSCDGSGKTRDPLWRSAFGTCRSCGGRGRHPRLGVRVLTPGRARQMTGGQAGHKSVDKRD